MIHGPEAPASASEARAASGTLARVLQSAGPVAQMIRFAMVGVPTSLLDFGVLNASYAVFGTRTTPEILLANTLGYLASMITSYFGNRRFTFHAASDGQSGVRRFLPYAAVSLSGYFIESAALVLIWGVFQSFGAAHGFLAADGARILAAIPTLAWTFLLYRDVVFAPGAVDTRPIPGRTHHWALPAAVRDLVARYPLVPLAGLVGIGLLLRLPFLLALPLGTAEWTDAHSAYMWVSGHSAFLAGHVSVMSLLVSVLFRLTGPSLTEPRILAAAAGALSVAATFFLARALWSSAVGGLLAALVVAVNGPAILASHVAVSGVFAPLVISLAMWAMIQGLEGSLRYLFLSAALWCLSLALTPWAFGLVPGVAVVLAGSLTALPVPRHVRVVRTAGWLAAFLGAVLLTLAHPVLPGDPFWATDAVVTMVGNLSLLPSTLGPLIGAAVVVGLVGTMVYGLRSRRARLLAIPLLTAILAGPVVVLSTSVSASGATALLPLVATLAVGAGRWALRRLSRRVPSGAYAAVAFLTATVVAIVPLSSLGRHDGHLLQADEIAQPAPQVLKALAKAGLPPKSHAIVLLDTRGARSGVVAWVLGLKGYHVRFIGNPYALAGTQALPGTGWTRQFVDPAGPVQAAAFVITPTDFRVLERSGTTAQVLDVVATHLKGGYVVGDVLPYAAPRANVSGMTVPGPGGDVRGSGVGAGPGS